MNSIHPLFSYPVMTCNEKYKFSDKEELYFQSLKMENNIGNLMSKDDRVLVNEELSSLKEFIDRHIIFYTEKVLRLKPENTVFITQSWINRSKTNDFHPKHKHPNSLLSGVMFLTGRVGDEMPPIRFHRGNDLLPLELEFEEYNDFNSGVKWFSPEKGMLIVFPSVLEHSVDQNFTGAERVSLSFNTFVRGPLGNKAQLTEVMF